MWVVEALEHLQLVEDHALIALDILLQDDLDRNSFAVGPVCFSDDAICTRTQGSPESILGSGKYMC